MPTGEPPGAGRPFINHLHRFGVHDRDLVFIHEVDVSPALLIGGEKLGLASKLNRRVGFARPDIQVGRNRNQHPRIPADDQNLSTAGS